MLDIESCIALSGLTEEEIEALAKHAHIPEMLAVELGSYLARLPDGPERICEIIGEEIRAAQRRGDVARAVRLKLILGRYLEHHGAPSAAN